MSRVEIETVSLSEGASDRALWRAVIVQAINDATMFCDPNATGSVARSRLSAKRDAVDWFTKPNAHFDRVCAFADFEPSQVRRLAQAWIVNAELQRKREARSREVSAASKRGAITKRNRGVVENFDETRRDRSGSVAQDCA